MMDIVDQMTYSYLIFKNKNGYHQIKMKFIKYNLFHLKDKDILHVISNKEKLLYLEDFQVKSG